MKLKLSVGDRLVLLSMLPREGDLITLRTVRDAKTTISFSDAEREALKLKSKPDGTVEWDTSVEQESSIALTDSAFEVILTRFDQMDKEKKIPLSYLDTYEKLMQFKVAKKLD